MNRDEEMKAKLEQVKRLMDEIKTHIDLLNLDVEIEYQRLRIAIGKLIQNVEPK